MSIDNNNRCIYTNLMALKKVLSYLFLLTLALLIFTATVNAQGPGRRLKNSVRCAQVTKIIDNKIKRFNSGQDHPLLQNFYDKLGKLIADFKAKNYDTGKLETDQAILKTKMDGCKSAFGLFIDKLQATKNFACGESQGQFRTALQAAVSEMVKAQAACKDARSFIGTVVKADLKSLRSQTP